MVDSTLVKGFRTKMAYYPESTYGTYSVTSLKCQRVGGKVRGVNWTARQNIMQTGNVGDGRNYKQQILGQYDATASLNFEVCDLSFLRFGVGDVAMWSVGTAEATPFFLVESELSGTDGGGTSQSLLNDSDNSKYTNVRTRPFSMLLYDMENAADGTTWNDSVDMLTGCFVSDFSISSAIGSPLTSSVNMVVKEVQYRRFLADSTEVPDFTGTATYTDDFGNGYAALTPLGSQYVSDNVPLMFYNGEVSIDGNVLGQVQSFNYSWNNGLLTYRQLGDRFIALPQLGMRKQTLSMNVIFSLLADNSGAPAASKTSILELIKNYLGYASTAPFINTTTLRPPLATTASTTSPQITKPIEKAEIKLKFQGNDNAGADRGAIIRVYNAAIEGFGVPITLENGLIEVPITCSVRGYPYTKVSDGSYNGYSAVSLGDTKAPGVSESSYNATFLWWQTVTNS
ncbi:hypothetical protein D4R86_00390 [bacterium]|nr:MAG: hypothetical protein D4R86_00390 [bacterium]